MSGRRFFRRALLRGIYISGTVGGNRHYRRAGGAVAAGGAGGARSRRGGSSAKVICDNLVWDWRTTSRPGGLSCGV